MLSSPQSLRSLSIGSLRRVHHIALNVSNMQVSRQFYGEILGLHELAGEEVPKTLVELVKLGKVANFITPDGTVLDLFWEPDLLPPDPDPKRGFTRANHLAFDIDPKLFDEALLVLEANEIAIAEGPVTRPTGRGVYFFMIQMALSLKFAAIRYLTHDSIFSRIISFFGGWVVSHY